MKGSSAVRDLAAIACRTRRVWYDMCVDPWLEYVPSEANLADLPSRQDYGLLLAMGAVRVPFPLWEELAF